MPRPKSSPAFEKAFAGLNPEQQLAVNTIDGPVMVIAGPGTGKTQVLAMRIANILLKTDTNPSSILALTFTESGANAMRKRLVSFIGETAYYVHIQTFHSFCSEVIQNNPEFFPIGGESTPLSDLERFHIFEEILNENSFQFIKPMNAPMHYLKAVLGSVQDLKREGISPDSFAKILEQEKQSLESEGESLKKTEKANKEKQLQKNFELLTAYRLYGEKIREVGKFDFEDMISLTVEAFQHHELLLTTYQERLLYILVDEYQDTNSAQNTVVDLLGSYWGEQANVFVVGDPNQSIYRFQGASLENTYGFLERYQSAVTITLKQNYRSTQNILDASQSLIDHNSLGTEKLPITIEQNLQSQKGAGEKLLIYEPASNTLEYVFIAEKIQSLVAEGEKPENIAVIYRNNADSSAITDALVRWNIPYEIEGGSDVLKDPIIFQLLLLMKVVRDIRSGIEDIDFFTLLNYQWLHLHPLTVLKLTRFAADSRTQIFTILSSFSIESPEDTQLSMFESDRALESLVGNIGEMETGKIESEEDGKSGSQDITTKLPDYLTTEISITPTSEIAKNFYNSLTSSQQIELGKIVSFTHDLIQYSGTDAFLTFPQWFEVLINRTGYLGFLLSHPKSIEYLNRLNSLFSEIKKLSMAQPHLKLADFLANIEIMQNYKIQIQEEDLNIKRNAVRLITAHKSKGLEWKHVFITQVIDKKWGNTSSRDLIKLPEGILKHTDVSDKEQNEDERRLFYVALTRAKEFVYVTVPKTITTGNSTRETAPSMFVEEIDKEFKQIESEFENVYDTKSLLEKLLSSNQQTKLDATVEEKEFLASIIERFKMSPTALNTYLDCPYRFKLEKLLKVPQAKQPHLSYGTAVHKALEFLFQFMKDHDDKVPALDQVLTVYTEALQKELLTPEEFEKRHQHGLEILTEYYQNYREEFVTPLMIEKNFGSGWSKPFLDDIPLTGRIDKIEWIDPVAQTVKVIDYKTGKPKSRNDIEGKTKSSDGSYKRQLVFYKLLAELDRSFKAKVEQSEFDFVQPNERGKFKKEAFHITDEEVEEMKELIRDTMQKIRNQEFPLHENESACSTCQFRSHCWPEGVVGK